jgi:simple sugar transport system permease protein
MSAVARPPLRERALASMSRRFSIEPRTVPTLPLQLAVALGSLVAALLAGALLLAATGSNPLSVYQEIVTASVGTPLAFSQTLVQTTPLLLTGLATVVVFRMRIFSIGADGQLLVGAVLASGAALTLGKHLPQAELIALTFVAGMLGGALWAGIAGVARAYWHTDEVISTLMLNYIALHLVSYLIIGSHSVWRDPANAQPTAHVLPDAAHLPLLFDQADWGVIVALVVAALVWVLLRFTRWGLETDVIGTAPGAARYAGMNVRRTIVSGMCLAGAIAGLAGAIQVVSVTNGLDPAGIDPGIGLGYAGIVVAALARLSPLACVPVAFLLAGLLAAGPPLELIGVPGSIATVLQGFVLLFVAGGQFLLAYRIRVASRAAAATEATS